MGGTALSRIRSNPFSTPIHGATHAFSTSSRSVKRIAKKDSIQDRFGKFACNTTRAMAGELYLGESK